MSSVWTLLLLWFAGLYLRLPVLVAPPLAPLIGSELGLNQTQVGAITTIPVLMLSLGAVAGSFAISRIGPVRGLVAALVLLALASSARGLAPPIWLLFAFTTLLGLCIAVMQTIFPALVLRWCPRTAALASAVYMNGMLVGEFVGGGLTLPVVMPLLDGSWRASLLAWSVPALPIAVAVLLRGRRESPPVSTSTSAPASWHPPWREPLMWQLGVVLGAASAGFFGANAYLGSLLEAMGQPERLAELLAWFNGAQVVGSLAMIGATTVLVGRRWPFVVVSVSILMGLAGLLNEDPGWLLPALLLLSLASCVQLILAVSLVPVLTEAQGAAPLAAGMFVVGYLLGFAVPLLGGMAADYTGHPIVATIPLIILASLGVLFAARLPLTRSPGGP